MYYDQLERERWLSEILIKHQSSILCSFIVIHSVMLETGNKVSSIVCGFRTK